MTEQVFRAGGFEPCLTPPPGWGHHAGPIYTCELPKGRAYVRCPPEQPGLVEAFVGDWARPLAYCRGNINSTEQLRWLLA